MFEPLAAGAIDKRCICRDFTYGFHVVVLIEFKQSYFFTIAFAREIERKKSRYQKLLTDYLLVWLSLNSRDGSGLGALHTDSNGFR